MRLLETKPEQHFTQPPPRFSEATLVKELEEKGIGRPSTYAAILSTVQDRGYVEKREGRLHPTELGVMVNGLLVKSFPEIVSTDFTAQMEEQLDQVEEGHGRLGQAARDFYVPFKKDLEKAKIEMRDVKREEEATDQVCEKCGKPMVIKWGRNGHFLACSGYPDCRNTKEYTRNADGTPDRRRRPPAPTDQICPTCGSPMVIKRGRFGEFIACSRYPDCKTTSPISLGVDCPKGCGGYLTEKRSKRGKVFFGCSNYSKTAVRLRVLGSPASPALPEVRRQVRRPEGDAGPARASAASTRGAATPRTTSRPRRGRRRWPPRGAHHPPAPRPPARRPPAALRRSRGFSPRGRGGGRTLVSRDACQPEPPAHTMTEMVSLRGRDVSKSWFGRGCVMAAAALIAASMAGCSHPSPGGSAGSAGAGGGGGGALGAGGAVGAGGTAGGGGTASGGAVGTGGVTGSGGNAAGTAGSGAGGAAGAGGLTGSGGGPMSCAPACPTGYTCDATGVCKGGTAAGLAFDVKTFSVSGAVTLNGANPVSSDTSCYASGTATNFPRGSVVLTDAAQGISFRADLQGCTNTAATFSTTCSRGRTR